ncbi:MAG: DUF4129 domain-containing protein [Thermoplasmata archaeon]|nr:DUF4129 domain-containing protein [Thermoplasmata archaeon]
MADRSAPRLRLSPVALIVIVAAVLLGVAAALLSGAPAAPSAIPSSAGPFVTYGDLIVFAWIVIGSVVAWVVYRLVQRIRDPSGGALMSRFASVWLVAGLIFLGFLVLVRLFVHGVAGGSGRPVPQNNSTGTPTPPAGGAGTPGNLTAGSLSIPGWEAYVGLIVVAVALAAVAIPVGAYLAARRRESQEADPGPTPLERSRAEIAAALAALEADPTADPRALVEALYGRLLSSVTDQVGGVEARTPREIERLAVGKLGLPPPAARELTALFEEARYSPHAITPKDVERARSALRRILDRIDSGWARP